MNVTMLWRVALAAAFFIPSFGSAHQLNTGTRKKPNWVWHTKFRTPTDEKVREEFGAHCHLYTDADREKAADWLEAKRTEELKRMWAERMGKDATGGPPPEVIRAVQEKARKDGREHPEWTDVGPSDVISREPGKSVATSSNEQPQPATCDAGGKPSVDQAAPASPSRRTTSGSEKVQK